MIAIGCDHGGYEIKTAVISYLKEKHIEYIDFGTDSTDSVDYPLYAYRVASAVSRGECERGILCCGTGIGVSIAANKVKGIRAAVCADAYCAEMTRRHNNANILCMGGRVIDSDTAVRLVDIFLRTPFSGGRHEKRVGMITAIENDDLTL